MGIKYDVKYDAKTFKGINPKPARKILRKYIQELCSGSSGNPLLEHWKDGQSEWPDDTEEYSDYKAKKYGTRNLFQLTGNALDAIKAKTHKSKKYGVSFRKKGGYFLLTATIREMKEGRNVYGIAQKGRFQGLTATSEGKQVEVSKDDFLASLKKANALYYGSEAEKAGVKIKDFKRELIKEKYKFDVGSTKRKSQNERLITMNLKGDERFVKEAEVSKYVEDMIKASGYKIK